MYTEKSFYNCILLNLVPIEQRDWSNSVTMFFRNAAGNIYFQIISFDELKTDYKNPIDQCKSLNPVS